jgi:hypothetical protein
MSKCAEIFLHQNWVQRLRGTESAVLFLVALCKFVLGLKKISSRFHYSTYYRTSISQINLWILNLLNVSYIMIVHLLANVAATQN